MEVVKKGCGVLRMKQVDLEREMMNYLLLKEELFNRLLIMSLRENY